MVPKGSFPLDLKFSSKGLSWVDLMYQKFEAICEGVDKNPPAIIQETTRFIDQISTVGANVQKICSNYMDDILAPVTEVDDKCLSSKYSANSEEDLRLTENSDQEEDTIESLTCEEVDRSRSAFLEEIASFVEHQTSTAGAKMQKFYSDLMEDILPPVTEVDDQCLSSKLSVNSEEDLKLTDPEEGSNETSIFDSISSPHAHQEAVIEIDAKRQLSTTCIQEENASLKSTEDDLAQVKTSECNFGADVCEKVFEDKGNLQGKNCLWEHAEPPIRQTNMLLQSGIQLMADRTEAVGIAEQEKNGCMDHAGKIKFEDPPSPGNKSLLENGILEVNLELEHAEQNHPVKDVQRGLSVVEPHITNPPACSKEGKPEKSLYVAVNEKEQLACWYGNPYVQARKAVDVSSSNTFVDVTDACRWSDAENSDSEWEIL